jgi:hypothetical protein
MTPNLHFMARSRKLCVDVHHSVDCSDTLGIKMLGADPVSAVAQKMLAACIPGKKCQPVPTGQRSPPGVLTTVAVIIPNLGALVTAM